MGNLISFFAALDQLGATNEERAKKLDIPIRTLTDYKRGRLPRFARMLLVNPQLAEALAADAKAGRTNGFNH